MLDLALNKGEIRVTTSHAAKNHMSGANEFDEL